MRVRRILPLLFCASLATVGFPGVAAHAQSMGESGTRTDAAVLLARSDTVVSLVPSNTSVSSVPSNTYSRSKRYFVEFRARNAASYGHMYVMYGEVNERREVIRSEIAGFFPAGDSR